jgi:hypothetical protein
MQQVRQHQPSRSGADNANLRSHQTFPIVRTIAYRSDPSAAKRDEGRKELNISSRRRLPYLGLMAASA